MRLITRELTTEEYPLWDTLLATSPQRSLFAERWWLDAATDGGYRLLGCFNDKRLMAGVPLWPVTMLGVPLLRQPPLTPYWGPLLAPLEGKYYARINTEMSLLRAMAKELRAWPDLILQCYPTLGNWLPFHWEGYQQLTCYTYRIEQFTAEMLDAKLCQRDVRWELQRAQKAGLHIQEMVDPATVARLYAMTMARQDREPSAIIQRVWPRLAEAARQQGRLLTTAAVDGEGNVHAASAMVWDDRCAYGLMAGGDPSCRTSYAGTLLQFHELQRTAEMGLAFDFEGSMIEPIEHFFRRFGGELQPYLVIKRAASWRLNTARATRQHLTALTQRRAKVKPRTEETSEQAGKATAQAS